MGEGSNAHFQVQQDTTPTPTALGPHYHQAHPKCGSGAFWKEACRPAHPRVHRRDAEAQREQGPVSGLPSQAPCLSNLQSPFISAPLIYLISAFPELQGELATSTRMGDPGFPGMPGSRPQEAPIRPRVSQEPPGARGLR